MNNIAFYPGAYDPFHFGHLKVAEKALKVVDKVFIAPNSDKPNSTSHGANLEDRVGMIKEGVDGRENLELYLPNKNVYLIEGERKFRYRSFLWFIEDHPKSKTYILAGSDKIKQDMYKDKNSELLNIPHILILRDILFKENIKTINNFSEIIIFPFYNKISGSLIKQKIKDKKSIKKLLPKSVMNYIIKNKLYGFS